MAGQIWRCRAEDRGATLKPCGEVVLACGGIFWEDKRRRHEASNVGGDSWAGVVGGCGGGCSTNGSSAGRRAEGGDCGGDGAGWEGREAARREHCGGGVEDCGG